MTSSRPPERRLRIVLHTQNLSGVGHYVRAREIARALATHHQVHIVDGGRPVPGAPLVGVEHIALPRIVRSDAALRPLDPCLSIDTALAQRAVLLRQAVERLRPDVLLIEYYPFSKWELQAEIEAAIHATRATNASARVICSVRDIPRQTRQEVASREEYRVRVSALLHAQFDALIVHGDPLFTTLGRFFQDADRLTIPIEYSGIVAEWPAAEFHTRSGIEELTAGAPFVLASVGGGVDSQGVLPHCIRAWVGITARRALPGYRLVVCASLGTATTDLEALVAKLGLDTVIVRAFSGDFLQWLQSAALSVSCAGYNTCANLLQARSRAILIPKPEMSDQGARAQLFAERGLAALLAPAELTAETLAAEICRAVARPRPQHALRLDGAARTRELLERFANGARGMPG